MQTDKITAAEKDYGGLFSENERSADNYASYCMLVASGVVVVMWILNLIGFFIVDMTSMNIAMSLGLVFFLVPPIMVLGFKRHGAYVKYISMLCFIAGITAMSSVLTIQLIVAWACPLALSLHYYSPKFTRFVLAASLVFMFVSFVIGIYIGVWDSNLMRSSATLVGVDVRHEFILSAKENGDNIILRGFNFYYLPRAVIISFIYVISEMLSNRTKGLLTKQSEIISDREKMGAELNVARHIQSSMLPCIFPAFPERSEIDIFATMTPAKEVGGDFYDFFMVDDSHLAVVMADVSGKGVPASLFMVIGKTLIKDHTHPGDDLGEVFSRVNNLLCEANSEGLFITAFEGVLDLETGEFVYVNAGHELPFICRTGESFEAQKIKHGFVLAGMEDMRYRAGTMTLGVGDKIFLYTDGVPEATDRDNNQYGMERLGDVLKRNLDKTPDELLPAVKADIDSFVGDAEQFDDITMLCLTYREKYKKNDR